MMKLTLDDTFLDSDFYIFYKYNEIPFKIFETGFEMAIKEIKMKVKMKQQGSFIINLALQSEIREKYVFMAY